MALHVRLDPVHSLSIPSLHDGIAIECRIYHEITPTNGSGESEHRGSTPRPGAIMAHPYAPFGGSMDDRVVQTVARTLVDRGYVVAVFNFRGAGGSGGKSSWTAGPELQDYASVVLLMLWYLRLMHVKTAAHDEMNSTRLIMGGYSYGSIITRRLPRLTHMIQSFDELQAKNHNYAKAIADAAAALVEPDASKRVPLTERGMLQLDAFEARYLLVSTLLPPMTRVLTLWGTGSVGPVMTDGSADEKLREQKTFVMYGDKDGFTSASKLRKWCEDHVKASEGRFTWAQIDGVGHFWTEPGALGEILERVGEWAT